MVEGMMANEKFVNESSRCVYENDDIWLVMTLCHILMAPEKQLWVLPSSKMARLFALKLAQLY